MEIKTNGVYIMIHVQRTCTQSCAWVGSTHGLGWFELGWAGLGWVEIFSFLVGWVGSWVRNISKNSKTW